MPASTTAAAFSLWHAPEALVDQFAGVHRVLQQEQARLMRLAAQMAAAVPIGQREHVGDDLAVLMNAHPRTGRAFVHLAVTADRLGLLDPLSTGELTERHVKVLVDEIGLWSGGDADVEAQIAALVLDRVRARLGLDQVWPTPGELRKRVATAALLLDLSAAEKARQSVAERREVDCFRTGIGQGTLSIIGPETQIVAIADAIRARAEAYGRLPGDTRTFQQRRYDAAYDLLVVDATGGQSTVPALDVDGVPVSIRVRGIEIQVLVPYSITQGGELELAEIRGFGPLLPQAAREVIAHADALRQVAVDATTGEVIAVEDRLPIPHDDTPAPEPEPENENETEPEVTRHTGVDPLTAALLDRMLDRPLQHLGPLQTDRYRPHARLLRAIRLRDRTCCFPGCTTPARWTDADHRDPWPRGSTSTKNLHCLCRRHHRAKQAYFTVETDEHGNTIWITPDGRRYKRPPPRF